jgi:tetratricopeptide (TPR) repeat protein
MKYRFLLNISLLLLLIVTNISIAPAQKDNNDSLETIIRTATQDTLKVDALNALAAEKIQLRSIPQADSLINISIGIARKSSYKGGLAEAYKLRGFIYERKADFDEAIKNHLLSLNIWKELNNKKRIANTYRYIGTDKFKQGNFSEAIKYLYTSLDIHKSINDKDDICHTYISLGNVFNHQGNYPAALENYLNALKIFEANNDKTAIAGTLNNIGNVYKSQKNYTEALNYHLRALELRQEIKDRFDIASSYNNIGIIYFSQHNYERAMENYMASLQIKKALGSKRDIAITTANIGLTFLRQKNYKNALIYLKDALQLYKEAGDKNGVSEAYFNLGEIFAKQKQLKNAHLYLDSALVLSEKIGNKKTILEYYIQKSQLDSLMGNYQSALSNYKTSIKYRDSLFNEENLTKMVQAQMNFEFDKQQTEEKLKQQQKDALQQQEIYRQKVIAYSLCIGFVLMLLLVITIYRSNKQKQRANTELSEKNELIKVQKQEVEFQKKLVEEKNQNITDSINYAKHIQASFLTADSYIAQHLNDSFILYKPKDIVSGDFYWIMERNDDIYVCTADCTGHGIPGAFMSLIGMGILNEIIHSKTHLFHTDEMLNELRRIIILAVNSENTNYLGLDGMDAVLLRLNRKKMELEYSAANNNFYIAREGQLLEFKSDKMPIGKHIGQEKNFSRHTVQLQKKDCIYTLSDGYADQFGGAEGKKFKTKRLKELFLKVSQAPMQEQKTALNEALIAWQGTLDQVDDITIVGIRV